MCLLTNALVAVVLVGVGYGICAYRVIREQAKEYEKLHRNDN